MRIKPTIGTETYVGNLRGAGKSISADYTSSTGTFLIDSFDGSENFRIKYSHNTSGVFESNYLYGANIAKFVLDANL